MRMIPTVGLLCATLLLGCGPKEARSDVAKDSKELVAPWTEMDLSFYGGEVNFVKEESLRVRWSGEAKQGTFHKAVDDWAAALEAYGWTRQAGPDGSGDSRAYDYVVAPDRVGVLEGTQYPGYFDVSVSLYPGT